VVPRWSGHQELGRGAVIYRRETPPDDGESPTHDAEAGMTNDELELLRQITSSGSTLTPEGHAGSDRQAFRLVVQRVRSLAAQGLVVADFLMNQLALEGEPALDGEALAVFCSLTDLGQLALAADRLTPPAISYTVDHAARVVRVTARGVVTARDHEAHVRKLAAAGLFGYRRLEDYRGAFVSAPVEELRGMLGVVRELRQASPPARTAFVTAQEMFYGMLRMYEALAAPTQDVRVFLDRGEAEGWLGLRA
jgi:hypothetical protein